MAKTLRRFWSYAALLTVAACATQPAPSSIEPSALLLETRLFEAPLDEPVVAAEEVLRLDDALRTFVDEATGRARNPDTKLRRLLSALSERGLETLDYTGLTTRTVAETFYAQAGNCLSFTMLFVTLAREAGLRVDYQIVSTPPTWSTVNDQVVMSTHINTLVKASRDYIVDFNLTEFQLDYKRRAVGDDYVLALFYSNVGAEALIEEDYAKSFAYLREAIRTQPDLAAAWTNLGLLFSRLGKPAEAEAAYRHALDLSPYERSTLTNLVALYAATGDEASADRYRDRIERYQRRNPYYHYSLAQKAYEAERPEEALERLDVAIKLERNEHLFHFLSGQAHLSLGQRDEAMRSFRRARDLSKIEATRRMYDSKLEILSQTR